MIITSSKFNVSPEIFTNKIYMNEDQHGEKKIVLCSQFFSILFSGFDFHPYFAEQGFDQFTLVLLNSVLHILNLDHLKNQEFACYICIFLSQQKKGKLYFASDLFLLVMVKHISIFNIFISKKLHCVPYLTKQHRLKELIEN